MEDADDVQKQQEDGDRATDERQGEEGLVRYIVVMGKMGPGNNIGDAADDADDDSSDEEIPSLKNAADVLYSDVTAGRQRQREERQCGDGELLGDNHCANGKFEVEEEG